MKLKNLRWWILSLVAIATVINYIDRNALAVMWPGISEELGLTKDDYALILSSFMIAYAIGQSAFGKIFDAIGTRYSFLLAIGVWSAAVALHAVARTAASFSVVRFVMGFGEAGNWPGATKANAEWFPINERALAQGIFNTGAALGAVFSLYFGFAAAAWLLPIFALIGAAGAMALLALIAGRNGGIALFTLAGLMIASLAGSLMSLAISLAPNPFAQSQIVTWLMGALTDRSWADVYLAAPLTLLGIVFLGFAGRGLDALTLGEATARSMGINPGRLQVLLIAGVGLTVGSGVAVAGIIGFVGLIVPHLVRPMTDRRPSSLIVPSALAGALLVLVADSAVRILPFVTELRLGIALSLIGAVGAAITVGVRRGGLLLSILVLPLYVPTLIFGAEAARRGATGMAAETPLLMLAGISAGVIALMPFASAAVLRINLR